MGVSICLTNVSKQYGKIEAVKDISFIVQKGRISAFLGPNGAGKSTTMKLISSLLSPTSGKIIVEGYSMQEQSDEIKRRMGVVFQEDVLDPELTVCENLYYRGSLYYDTKRQVLSRLNHVSTLLSLEELLQKPYKNCSGGQKRICQIGRALMSNPALLLLDEPTIGLDPIARERVWDVLLHLNRRCHMTIFYSTHYMEETIYADHICMINRGKILYNGSKDHILHTYERMGCRTIQDIYMYLLTEDACL